MMKKENYEKYDFDFFASNKFGELDVNVIFMQVNSEKETLAVECLI